MVDTYTISSSAATVTLNMPSTLSFQDGEDLVSFHFFSGADTTFHINKNTENITLNGTHTTKVYASMASLDIIAEADAEITITGLPNSSLNTTWVIENFSYTCVAGTPSVVNYSLTLEKT